MKKLYGENIRDKSGIQLAVSGISSSLFPPPFISPLSSLPFSPPFSSLPSSLLNFPEIVKEALEKHPELQKELQTLKRSASEVSLKLNKTVQERAAVIQVLPFSSSSE